MPDKITIDDVTRVVQERDMLRAGNERLRARLAAAERVVEAARYDHMDPEDGVEQGVYDNLCGLCQALQTFDAATVPL